MLTLLYQGSTITKTVNCPNRFGALTMTGCGLTGSLTKLAEEEN